MKPAPYGLVDIGCNLTSPRLIHDLEEVLAAADCAGVTRQIITGSDLQSNQDALALACQYPQLFATAGFHPHHANDWQPHSHPLLLQSVARQPEVVAVGEMGLDYHRNFSTPLAQQRCFSDQLDIAIAVQKPVFLHERDAFADFHRLLTDALPQLPRAVWHCFTADTKALEWALDAGLYIGITGWICDPERGKRLREQVRIIPEDRLMLETDAPYLTPKTLQPTPRTNKPQYLPEILRMVSKCRQQPPEEIAQQTTQNAERFFQLSR